MSSSDASQSDHDEQPSTSTGRLSFMRTLSRTFSFSSRTGTSNRRLSRRQSTGDVDFRTPSIGTVTTPAFGTIETYQKLEKLGEGTYASVFKGISKVNGKLVALKEITLEHEEGAPCTAIREVSLLKGLKHNNIVTLHDVIHTKTMLTMVFEYLEKDLKKYMDDCSGYIHLDNVRLFTAQLLRGLAYCHRKKVLHRDLKPQNLLINARGELKLADFGLARARSVPIKTYSNEVVTLWYRPPDVLLGSVGYYGDIDMWGVGCIMLEMLTGRPVFPGANNREQLRLIFRLLGSPDPQVWPEVESLPEFTPHMIGRYRSTPIQSVVPRLSKEGVDLLTTLVSYDPKKRPTAVDALRHPYFGEMGSDILRLSPRQSVFSVSYIKLESEAPRSRSQAARSRPSKRRTSVRF